MHRQLTALALAAAALGTAAAARADEPQGKKVERMVIVHAGAGDHATALPDPAQIPGDHLRVDDLATYAAGETRSYTTEGGAEVTITRAQDGSERYTLQAGDRQIEIGGAPHEMALAGGDGMGQRIIIRHEVEDGGDGTQEIEEERVVGGPVPDLLVAGEDGASTLVVEIVGEKDGKATRQLIVLKTVEKVETN